MNFQVSTIVSISVASMKFAGYVVWILIHKIWKCGSNPY